MALLGYISRLRDQFGWRWDRLCGRMARRLQPNAAQWTRLVMDRETAKLVSALPYKEMQALEISGTKWREFGFASYRSLAFPEYDLCQGPLEAHCCDLVLLEQVLEHVLWPLRAICSTFEMLRPGGHLLVTTPFLVKIHRDPVDCSRWTELGLKYLLAEGGYPLADTVTGSWGNRMCVRRTLRSIPGVVGWWHTLHNEPDFPVVVWALARKPGSA